MFAANAKKREAGVDVCKACLNIHEAGPNLKAFVSRDKLQITNFNQLEEPQSDRKYLKE
jgi:hypothetical protein